MRKFSGMRELSQLQIYKRDEMTGGNT